MSLFIREMSADLKVIIRRIVREEIDLVEKLRTFKPKGKGPGLRFDIRAFKQLEKSREMVEYAKKFLTKLGSGISRMTFLLSSGKVLKIAYKDSSEQNEQEVKAFQKFGSEYTPVIYETHPDGLWIISELVRTFENAGQFREETGLTEQFLIKWAQYITAPHASYGEELFDMNNYLKWLMSNYPEIISVINKYVMHNTITPRGEELIKKMTHLIISGADDIQRWDHWGIGTDQRIVCVDLGYVI